MFEIINYKDVENKEKFLGVHFPRNILRHAGQIKVNMPKSKRDACQYKWRVPPKRVQEILEDCSQLAEDEIIEKYYGDFCVDKDVQQAFKIMCISDHEVDQWIYLNIK